MALHPNYDNQAQPASFAEVRAIYERCGVLEETASLINRNTEEALTAIDELPYAEGRDFLKGFANMLMKRDF